MSDDVRLEFFGADTDPAESERLSLALRRELMEITEVEAVTPATAGPAPPGARGLDLVAIGGLLVSVRPTIELLGKVMNVVQAWLNRHGDDGQTMKVTINGQSIELTATKRQQSAIVAQYLKSVATPQQG